MTISRIPTSTVNENYEFIISLDNVEFKLAFHFNSRDSAWYLTIKTLDDVVLRAGLRVVNEWALLRLWVGENRPAGEMVTVNQGELDRPPLANQLGAEVVLDYLDASEVEALG